MTEKRQGHGARAVIHRDGPDWDGLRTATISGFRCADASGGAALLTEITDDLVTEGVRAVLGPMEGDTWHSYRLVSETDGSKPFLMEPTSGAHDQAAFEAAGFTPVSQYFSARLRADQTEAMAIPADPDLLIETWDGQNPEAHFSQVYDLSVRAFRNNLFYKPIARDAFLAMYMPFVPMLRPELILLARDKASGVLLGFLFGIPNYQEGPKPPSVILKSYASLKPGVGHRLSDQFHRTARETGFQTVIHALIADVNDSADRSRKHGAEVFRRYALMGRVLD